MVSWWTVIGLSVPAHALGCVVGRLILRVNVNNLAIMALLITNRTYRPNCFVLDDRDSGIMRQNSANYAQHF